MSIISRQLNKPLQLFLRGNPSLLSAALAIALLIFFTLLALDYIYQRQEQLLKKHLEASVNSYAEQINIWQQQNLSALQMLANSPQGAALLTQVLQEQGHNPATHKNLEAWLAPLLLIMGLDGYSVINHERVIVAARTESYRHQPVKAPETLEVLDKALARKPAVSRPIAALRPVASAQGDLPVGSMMQNMCILFANSLAQPGYLCLRFNTERTFFPLFLKGRTGESGEIYAIDQFGRFITPARILHTAASTDPAQTRIWKRVARPSSRTEPPALTAAAQALVENRRAFAAVDYEDYHGARTAGAGRWLDEMELGIIVEQDIHESMAPYYAARTIILALSLSANVLIILLTVTAILNRRRLLAREGRFRSLLDNLPPPVHMTAMNNRLIVVNPAFCALLGIERRELLGRDIHQLPMPAWLKPLVVAEAEVSGDSYSRDFIYQVLDPEQKPRYFRIVRFPVVYSQGEAPQAMACIWVDSTERVVANQQLAEVNQNLERLVDERTHELMIAKDEALAASQSKAEFLANMSHEIRTPLNAIIGLAHVALASKPEPKLRTYLEKMRGSGEHLLQVINDILNFSRMEAGKLHLDHSPFAIEQLVDKTLDLTWDKAAAKGLSMSSSIDPLIPKTLLGDALRLGQILINLCANAVKFTEQGSVKLRVAKVRDWQDKVELLFEVEDTGIGISAAQLPQLFQPFEQVDASSARRFEGTGLGLSICKKLADLMHGRIDVKSTPGQGSCFRLRITLDKQPSEIMVEAVGPEPMPAELPPLKCKVLVVEDNALNQEIILSLLEAMGAQVICVGSGPEAIATVLREPLDVILMDIQLPGMDGVETSLRIRALAAGRNLPIIALTANALPGDRETYLAAGLDDYLAKPIAPLQLHQLLVRWSSKTATSPAATTTSATRVAVAATPELPAAPFALLQQGGINVEQALANLMNNEQLYRRLLARFAQERGNFAAEFTALLNANASEALNQVHSLKSLAASLGMLQLSAIAAQLEQQLRDGQQPNFAQLCADLSGEMCAMVELVAAQLNAAPARN